MNQELDDKTREWLSKTTNLAHCLFCKFYDTQPKWCKEKNKAVDNPREEVCDDWRYVA